VGRPVWLSLGQHAELGRRCGPDLGNSARSARSPGRKPGVRMRLPALLPPPFVPYAGAVPDGGRHGLGGEVRRAPIV
jgi:hypothetical protein